ncbi:MAG TPA: GGDEF domain-containing protein [Desulfobacteraceae bacterium]|nr:GGDEF domain-containing protein [Desulfobacteraceae bacterium]
MHRTDKTLMEQMKISGREIRQRKALLGFGPEDVEALKSLKKKVTDTIEVIVANFYEKILNFDEMDRLIGDAGSLSRLKNYQRNYILTLFDGEYGEEYVHSRLRVGMVHRRIGLDPQYYIAAVHHLKAILQEVVIQGAGKNCVNCGHSMASLDKIIMFDLTLIVDTYIDSLMEDARHSRHKLAEYIQSLEETVAERTKSLAEQARHDGLTGLLNQHAFYQELKRELIRSNRLDSSVTLLYFDLDGFKALNDTQGHQAGDEVLKKVADAVTGITRRNEITARYGGDEFCIILPESIENDGRNVAGRVFEVLEKALEGSGVSCSIGIAASTPQSPLDADALVKAADQAMYLAKRSEGFTVCDQADLSVN